MSHFFYALITDDIFLAMINKRATVIQPAGLRFTNVSGQVI
jgi:uncharacterized protein YaiI (UPF0178 family)